ncbi:NADPH:quinone reductase [Gordonia malaquae]|uniref:Putative oxidoreductase n=1 Tax=Gordonia malaquae NBRC 108250 TaxID=1223542 RepID=M3UL42_GORML|nr:NADP-dependent oxidoreductase [Gordonia malaquae]GAC80400.1 putative oxidoreductase [Gordonia malaquae NBRC 108250]SEB52041.1 NADPH:quinone reductase [Gordonia malaquae]
MTGRRWRCSGPDGLADFEFVQVEGATPGPDEVRVEVSAAGVNPADLKHTRRATAYPVPVGYEIAGVVTDVGSAAAGLFAPGDRVVAFRVHGGYATELTFPAEKAFILPDSVDDVAAAGLLLAGTTAADMLHRSGASDGDTILVHGASGAVGATLLQLAARRGVRVVGTAGAMRFDAVRRFGGVPVAYGPGLIDRLHGWTFDAALDLAGTDEATDASLALVPDKSRIITAANKPAADRHGFVAVAGMDPESTAFRDAVRPELIGLLAAGELEVPVAQTFPLAQAREALELVASGTAGGKVVLTV